MGLLLAVARDHFQQWLGVIRARDPSIPFVIGIFHTVFFSVWIVKPALDTSIATPSQTSCLFLQRFLIEVRSYSGEW